jgi:hypothetical protein
MGGSNVHGAHVSLEVMHMVESSPEPVGTKGVDKFQLCREGQYERMYWDKWTDGGETSNLLGTAEMDKVQGGSPVGYGR